MWIVAASGGMHGDGCCGSAGGAGCDIGELDIVKRSLLTRSLRADILTSSWKYSSMCLLMWSFVADIVVVYVTWDSAIYYRSA